MWMHNLIQYINRIKINADLQIDSIDQYTSDISVIDASHMRYGDTLPIIPKLTFQTIETGGMTYTDRYTRPKVFFPDDDEIIIQSSVGAGTPTGYTHRKYTLSTEAMGSEGAVTVGILADTLHLEKIGSYYYGMGYKYEADFSAVTTFSPATAFSSDTTKNTFESDKICIYKDTSKYILNLDGTLDSTVDWLPEDRMYVKGIDIGNESWNNRFIRTLRDSGDIYFLDKFLIPFMPQILPPTTTTGIGTIVSRTPSAIRKVGTEIIFARLIGEAGEYLHLTRMELI
jgi:hypothetical protein